MQTGAYMCSKWRHALTTKEPSDHSSTANRTGVQGEKRQLATSRAKVITRYKVTRLDSPCAAVNLTAENDFHLQHLAGRLARTQSSKSIKLPGRESELHVEARWQWYVPAHTAPFELPLRCATDNMGRKEHEAGRKKLLRPRLRSTSQLPQSHFDSSMPFPCAGCGACARPSVAGDQCGEHGCRANGT